MSLNLFIIIIVFLLVLNEIKNMKIFQIVCTSNVPNLSIVRTKDIVITLNVVIIVFIQCKQNS